MNDELGHESPLQLAAAGETERGHHRVFLGMAAGVGKTYRMLLEGHAAPESGQDVVIGLLETHGRADTAKLAEGLEIVPRRRLTYRDTALEEMDLPGILLRSWAHLQHKVPGISHPSLRSLATNRDLSDGSQPRMLKALLWVYLAIPSTTTTTGSYP